MRSYWRRVDGGLIRRGTVILDLEFVKRYADELRDMNYGKNSCIIFLTIFRYVFSVRFRRLEGFTISLRKMFPNTS